MTAALALAALLAARAGSAPLIGAEVPADAPFVPALPAATPQEGLARLRADAAAGKDDEALGEAYDFLKRYPSRPEAPEVRLAAGALHLRRGETQRALRFLLPLARDERSPLYGRATHLAAGALLALGRNEAVLKLVPAEANGDPWLRRALVWRAAAARALGRPDEAAVCDRAAAEAIADSPAHAYALAAWAADLDRSGREREARDALSRAQAEAARWGLSELEDALTLSRAELLARMDRQSQAAAAYARFAAEHPRSPLLAQALYERGLALRSLGRRDAAAAAFESLLKRARGSVYAADAHLQLGQLAVDKGLLEEALDQYRAMARDAGTPDAERQSWLLEAKAYDGAGRWSDAVPLYRRFLKEESDPAKAREVKGLLLSSLWRSDPEDPQAARLAAELPQHPLAPRVRWRTASEAYRSKKWGDAERLFRAAESDPDRSRASQARFYRAEALRELGRTDDAEDEYRRFLREAPREAQARAARKRLADFAMEADYRAAADLGANDAAILAWEAFARRYPRHPKAAWAWWRAGRLREKRKETAAAMADYAKLERALPKDDPARLAGLLRLALLLELSDRPKRAAPLYVEILRRAPRPSPAFETARKRLQALTSDRSLLKR